MLSMSILVRGAVVGLMLAGFVAVTDNMARSQLSRAVENYRGDGARVVVQIAGAVD